MTMFNKVSKSFRFGDHDVTLTTGEIARHGHRSGKTCSLY